MAKKPPSPAQRANDITFALLGHLKNVQLSYLRVAKGLAQIRDQRLFAALKFDSIEGYAKKRLRLGRAATYRYLQIHDWVREFHPGWLARRPKGFIPELSDVYALISIERWLADEGLDERRRRDLENARRKALAGELSDAEFRELRGRARKETPPLRAFLASLRVARKRAKAVPGLSDTVLADLDRLIARVEGLGDVMKQVAKLVAPPRARRRESVKV